MRIKQSRNQALRAFQRPQSPFKAISKLLTGSDKNSTDKQVEALLEQSSRAERMRQIQRDAYHTAQREAELKEQQERQSPGQSTGETCDGSSPSASLSALALPQPLPIIVGEEPSAEVLPPSPGTTLVADSEAKSLSLATDRENVLVLLAQPITDPPASPFFSAAAVEGAQAHEEDEEWEF